MKLNIIGPINTLGYGIHTSNMINSLVNNNVEVSAVAIDGNNNSYYDNVNKSLSIEVDHSNPSLFIYYVDRIKYHDTKNNYNFVIFETDKINDNTISKINEFVSVVLTTTQEHKDILIKHGVVKPVHVVHEGVNSEIFNYELTDRLINTNKYTYLLLGKYEKRKNTNLVISAFIEKMQYENVALICHTYNHDIARKTNDEFKKWYKIDLTTLGYNIIEETNYYIKFSNTYSDIYLTKPILEINQMKSLYQSANIGISYSSAEGWGLPEMEMMACGKPVIISNVIGHKEYIKDLPVFRELIIEPVGSELAIDGFYFNGQQGSWSKMDINPLIEKLEYVYKNNIGDYISKELSDYITTNFSWDKASKELINIIKGYNK